MHPLEKLDPQSRKIIFIFLLILTVIIMLVMSSVGESLNTEEAPYGIISFELAGSVQNAERILNSWDQSAQIRASFIQGLDFLYLLVYSTTLVIGVLWAGETLKKAGWPPASASVYLAWGMWLAGVMDAVENIALVRMLFGGIISPLPEIAAFCAIIKFALIFIGLVYTVYTLVIRYVAVRNPRDESP